MTTIEAGITGFVIGYAICGIIIYAYECHVRRRR